MDRRFVWKGWRCVDIWYWTGVKEKEKKKEVKFILVISLCSFINNKCLPPIEVKVEYNSWKECTTAALEISKQLIIAQEDNFINNNKVATKFMCEEVSKV